MSLNISKHFDKDNLHHAYLIEGVREDVLPEILTFVKSLSVDTTGNSDFTYIAVDSFKIDDARNLKSFGSEKGMSDKKKIFVISANNFLLEAQHSLLKMFEEPIENTHFFLILPDVNALLKTVISRFYFISTKGDTGEDTQTAEKFIAMPLPNRINFIKELLVEPEEEDEEGNEIIVLDSTRFKALKFLNSLEIALHHKMSRTVLDIKVFSHFFKVREFLRQPGSSTKSLLESVALIVPEK